MQFIHHLLPHLISNTAITPFPSSCAKWLLPQKLAGHDLLLLCHYHRHVSVCSPDSFLQPSLASFQNKVFLPPLALQDRQTTGKREDANCKSAVLQVFLTSHFSHQYLLLPCFSGLHKTVFDWIHKNTWNHCWCDRQTATMCLAWKSNFKSLSRRHFPIKEAQSGFKHCFYTPDFNATRFQEIFFFF